MADETETDPRLLEILKSAGDEWGPLGVALVAAGLTDRDVLIARLQAGEMTTAPRTEVQWAVAYGGDDPNECAGVLEYDDQADAQEHLQWVVGGFLATRTLTVWPWQRAEATP